MFGRTSQPSATPPDPNPPAVVQFAAPPAAPATSSTATGGWAMPPAPGFGPNGPNYPVSAGGGPASFQQAGNARDALDALRRGDVAGGATALLGGAVSTAIGRRLVKLAQNQTRTTTTTTYASPAQALAALDQARANGQIDEAAYQQARAKLTGAPGI